MERNYRLVWAGGIIEMCAFRFVPECPNFRSMAGAVTERPRFGRSRVTKISTTEDTEDTEESRSQRDHEGQRDWRPATPAAAR